VNPDPPTPKTSEEIIDLLKKVGVELDLVKRP
jgi:hypothetical protein